MAKRAYPSAKSKILQAAEAVLRREGPRGLSVDAVVAEAGLSKGGFFYHFKTKEELLIALVRALGEEMMADVLALAGEDPEPRGRALRAVIRCSFEYEADAARRDRFASLMLVLMTVAIESREVLEVMRQDNDAQLAAFMADGLSPAQALLLNSALEGFWLGQALGSTTVAPELRVRLHELLIALTRVDLEAVARGEPAET